MRVLIVEDEVQLSEALGAILEKNNYIVDRVFDGEDGLDYIISDIYDVVILDIMLPKLNGLEVLKRARKEGIDTPIILLTAKGEVSDKVAGLDCGADDYLPKPFYTEELLARIRALGRRKGEVVNNNALEFHDITLNVGNLDLSCNGKVIKLTAKECGLLELLINRKGMITNKDDIISKLWGYESDAEHNNVEVYVSFIRRKLTHLKSKVVIKAIRNMGYILEYKDGE
ncbi:DNA-binding response regulator, OmpR family, contains REC and winged-helix (wHTH) domain [Clostridium sp. DSM 8431]|uniref:response regulator transcription factor n=1 Tax=Clostridium sp. DSM 8431 TaxID=1761781 RepID=UPI0008DF9B44|nr:response regulator transcription factor [Clostridium sp. DSM 8431]SFU30169.1 DNA-binding response regulator, OmpR family, contains REC and winged-helix (wHTH) domain [Clostridium sp. DSM 8431]